MTELAKLTRAGDVGVITLNNPPVNALSTAVAEQILDAVETLRGDESVRAVVLIGGGRAFCGGADINKFGQITSGQVPAAASPIPRLLEAVEQFPKPVVCAIHGFAFGGGLELAMACHYRVAVATAQVGQPEVKIGLIPGAGGTQRLPRLAGVALAAEMCAGGNPVAAAEACDAGILDRIVAGDLLEEATHFAREVLAGGEALRGRAHSRRSFAIRWPTTWSW